MPAGTCAFSEKAQAAQDAGYRGFSFFEFALVGLPLLIGTMAIIVLFGEKLLPFRNGASMPADFSRHAQTLIEQYGLSSGVFRLRVKASSPLAGTARDAVAGLQAENGLDFVAVQDGKSGMPLRRDAIAEGDYLILKGDADAAARFAARQHLALREEADVGEGGDTLFNRNSGLAEVVIPPRSGLIGSTAFPGMVTESGDLIILSILRAGVTLDEAMKKRLNDAIKTALSPRFIPNEIFQVAEIPRTLSGKKQELPIKKLMLGHPLEKVVNKDAMANPGCLDWYVQLAREHMAKTAA